jgi:DNA-binding response OmpR family regulator
MINQGSLVSKKDMSEKVLGKKLASFARSIDMHVINLRKKLVASLALKKKSKRIVVPVIFTWCLREEVASLQSR